MNWKNLLQPTDSDPTGAARTYIRKGREILQEAHRAGAGGTEIVTAYTGMMDHLISTLFESASRDYSNRYPSMNTRCGLIALGGYGREELNPQSDIDLLFVHVWKVTPFVENVAEKILYALWDSGLQVGHAIRSISESVRLGNKETHVKTAMIDARFLSGDLQLYKDLKRALQGQFSGISGDRFIRRKIEEHHQRHERYGGSVYLSEPEIKEGEGGLRDIHTALWVAKTRWDISHIDELENLGVLSTFDLNQLKEARDFLWRVRNELHFFSGSHQDQLNFELQETIAINLGYTNVPNIKGVERFMRAYYLHAAQISRVTSLILHRATEGSDSSFRKPQSPGREIRQGVYLSRGLLSIRQPEILDDDPDLLMTFFEDAQRCRAEINQETRELLRGRAELIDEKFRHSASINATFLRILGGPERVYETLVEMHRCGVLDEYIPEFGRVLCMAQHDLYHIYTVDQHSLKAVKEFELLRSGAMRDSYPLLTQLARELDRVEVLMLGILFHDIGKGHGGNHSEIGSHAATKIARRLGLNVDERVQLTFLVLEHLNLSNMAFRRDIDDIEQVIDFAQSMGSVSNLKMLYLLTYADINAVAPGVWNNWKASLLEDLFARSLRVLEDLEKGAFRRPDSQSRIRRIQTRLRSELSKRFPEERIQNFFHNMPERYFLTTPETEMPVHFELMESFTDQLFLTSVRHFPEREYSEMAICAQDHSGLFAQITGIFASMGFDILSARINTRKDGLILDVFRISHLGRPEVVMEESKWTRVENTLRGVLTGTVDIARLVEESGSPLLFKRRPAPKVPTDILFDPSGSDDFTIIEVYTQDRTGVLFAITFALHLLGIWIHLAKISTNVDQVADVFYVTDGNRRKIEDPEQLETIRRKLLESLSANSARVA
ncbi:MAG: [protein-PII] uridylyltransferase [Deltaproteobacteria bacterium]|nr:[protein-PII] uridylyltransferase [Deltaproteobacteria bacterium]